jgi:hypothetical protein
VSSLNLEHDEPVPKKNKKKNRNLKIFLGIGALIAIPAIGSTLAASITVNSGPVQFGQGVSQAVSCQSGTLTVTPYSTFSNASGGGSFYLSSVAVSGISSTCNNKTFTLKVYGDTLSTPLTIASPSPTPSGATSTSAAVTFLSAGSGMTIVGNTNETVTAQSSTSFTISFGTQLDSTSIYKITVETS